MQGILCSSMPHFQLNIPSLKNSRDIIESQGIWLPLNNSYISTLSKYPGIHMDWHSKLILRNFNDQIFLAKKINLNITAST